jgi:hypothetical protein
VKAKAPHWPLERVQALVAADKVFAHRTSALDHFPTPADCYAAIKTTVANLTTREYAHPLKQGEVICDVYVVVLNGDDTWYFKYYIDEQVPGEEMTTISLHPLKYPQRTNSGVRNPKGWIEPKKPRR